MSEPVATERFRCSVSAVEAPMAGTAGPEASFLLVEYPGPWGHKALAESRLPEQVRTGLAEAADEAGVRVLLVRRHGRSGPPDDGFGVFLCHASAREPWVESTRLAVPEDLLDLDLDGLAAGRRPGLTPHEDALLLVCTNGRRDLCCAEFGRPVVAALAAAYAEQTWEVTHLGGHRFASAMLALPHGLSYGRLDPSAAVRVGELTVAGRLDPTHLRGRSAYDPAVQAAEISVLLDLGEDSVDALALERVSTQGDGRTRVTFAHGAARHSRVVEATAGPPTVASCAADRAKPTERFVVGRD